MNRQTELRHARSFQVYYGYGEEERLKEYDLVVVDPAGHTPDGLERLFQAGTLVIAYVSIMEIRPEDPFFSLLGESDWLRMNGSPVMNEAFGTRLLDLRSNRWSGLLHHRIGQLLAQARYDGIFLDTLGDLEWPALPPAVRDNQLQAAVGLIKGIRSVFPDHLLIQNNGLERLCLTTSEWIDAVCWENPLFFEPHMAWSSSTADRLSGLCRSKPLRVLLLFEQGPEAERSLPIADQYAEAKDWLICTAGRNYINI
ncbi:endo alpha-1,4 polygalactosaminidase [Ferviditalea candida]|uniref:Endo alpha-1,4 polygalactosaminidase n=1 Tax=Ferviditalea candida TaxID=3108399 RepID=A0ABU5ZFT4_9BACL|nr:endo alpha-1,4 polygalactosaminidase [Paenibacillaceae bacterium T2]